ncbi:MAG: DCC1-like thiol-disulfide oxidoreductase family protein [Planctomycetota bacterium]|nr:DCC1-like thiol-disulfide oxidoreductase family protein [Planctomycetota bacterium]
MCTLCERSVQFIIRHDESGKIRFAAQQSAAAKGLLNRVGLTGPLPDSVLLVMNGRVLSESDAAIGIGRLLGGRWRVLANAAGLLPRVVRDGLYRMIAKRRYRWFGRRETCLMPTEALRARFLDAGEVQGASDSMANEG